MKNIADKLHIIFNNLVRYSYPYESRNPPIPNNGIYILFEKGEKFKEHDRIVRVGIGKEDGNLKNRLNEHFINENKNRSIFRKNIGRAFLNKENSPYLKYWNLDTTTRAVKDKFLRYLDSDFETALEKEITAYIQTNITFCFIKAETKEERTYWENKIISTLAQSGISPSNKWLGRYSPKNKIKESGLWQEQHISDIPLSSDDLEELTKLIDYVTI